MVEQCRKSEISKVEIQKPDLSEPRFQWTRNPESQKTIDPEIQGEQLASESVWERLKFKTD